MKKITDYIWEACSVIGVVYLFAIGMSYFFPELNVLEERKAYVICLFLALVIGKCVLDKSRTRK